MRKSIIVNVNPPPIVSKVTDIPKESFLDGMVLRKYLLESETRAGALVF
jgi:hypothetical protein